MDISVPVFQIALKKIWTLYKTVIKNSPWNQRLIKMDIWASEFYLNSVPLFVILTIKTTSSQTGMSTEFMG